MHACVHVYVYIACACYIGLLLTGRCLKESRRTIRSLVEQAEMGRLHSVGCTTPGENTVDGCGE